MTIKEIAHLAPQVCDVFPDSSEIIQNVHPWLKEPETKTLSVLALVQEVPGKSLREIAESENGFEIVKHVIKKLWLSLPKIHKYWGFSGGLDKDGIHYDSLSGKITVLHWDRGQLPIIHLSEINEGPYV